MIGGRRGLIAERNGIDPDDLRNGRTALEATSCAADIHRTVYNPGIVWTTQCRDGGVAG